MQSKIRFLGRLLCATACFVFCTPTCAEVPRIVVSVNPFYGLVASVMQGVAKPSLLVKIGASPHEYTLKPSQMQQLQSATLIFWGGPALESFLIKPLAQQKTKTVAFDQVLGLETLALRSSMIWDSQKTEIQEASSQKAPEASHPHHGHHHHHDLAHGTIDMHFWLDPHNAIVITKAIVRSLSSVDPEHQKQYQINGEVLIQRLKSLDLKLQDHLKAVQTRAYVVFHDAYQYFETRYHLKGAGSISLHPELPPSAKRLKTIRDIIEQQKVVCLFSEPQFSPALVYNLAKELPIKTGVLDPIGTDPSPEGYFTLMNQLSTAFTDCLRP